MQCRWVWWELVDGELDGVQCPQRAAVRVETLDTSTGRVHRLDVCPDHASDAADRVMALDVAVAGGLQFAVVVRRV